MKLKLLSLAIVAAAVPFAGAQAAPESQNDYKGHMSHAGSPQVYGQIDVGLSRIDVSDNPDPALNGDSWDVRSNVSRFGIKGSEDLGGLTGIYQAEFEVDVADRDGTTDGVFKTRNSFVGVEGDFGRVYAGIYDSPFKQAQGKVDLFSDQYDMSEYIGGEERETSIIAYDTPEMSGIQGTIMFQPGERTPDNEADVQDGIADAVSVAVFYENDMIWAGLAYDMNMDWGYWSEDRVQYNAADDRTDAIRLAGILKFDNFGLGALFQTAEQSDIANPAEQNAVVLSAYAMLDQTKFEAQLGNTANERDGAPDYDAKFAALGVEQHLSDRTNVYAFLARQTDETAAADIDNDFLMVGAKHSF